MTPWQAEFFETIVRPLTASSLRRIFLLMMRFHFSDANNYGELRGLLKNLIWTDTEETTALDVELLGVFNPGILVRRPAVFVGFQNFQFNKKVTGDYAGESEDAATKYLVKTVDTELVIRCVAADEDMSTAMVDTATAFMFGMREMLLCKMRPQLRSLEVDGITDPKLVEKSPERRFQCDLLTKLNFNYTIDVNLESHPIKKVAVEWVPRH